MSWFLKLGEHARAITGVIVLLGMVSTGAAWAATSYIDLRVNTVVAQAIGDFRLEWRCSEWREELEKRLFELEDMDVETPQQRIALQTRVDRLRALIADNQCSRFDL